nr:hypothetical protein Itr_chr14CG05560 [Ipomoea trifida]
MRTRFIERHRSANVDQRNWVRSSHTIHNALTVITQGLNRQSRRHLSGNSAPRNLRRRAIISRSVNAGNPILFDGNPIRRIHRSSPFQRLRHTSGRRVHRTLAINFPTSD